MKFKYLILVEDRERAFFFLRFNNVFKKNRAQAFFVTNKKSITKEFKIDLIYSNDVNNTKMITNDIKNIIFKSIDYVSGDYSYTLLERLFNQSNKNIIDYVKKIDVIYLWNDCSFFSMVFSYYANKLNKKIIYLEYSNFPNNIICDPTGININSKYVNKYLRKKADLHIGKFTHWKKKYLKDKLHSHNIIQAYTFKYNSKYYLDFFYFFKFSKRGAFLLLLKKCIRLLFGKILQLFFKLFNFFNKPKLPKNFIFFPCQVSNDSQILLNSKIDNHSALKYIHENFSEKLVIKFHPAENNFFSLVKIFFFCLKNKIFISNENTFQLIKKSKGIVTINSNVGLEAKLMGKKVTYLENSIHDQIRNNETMFNYLFRYLLPIDYKSSECISQKEFDLICQRIIKK